MPLSPMMQQYKAIKDKNKDCIIFWRLGDLYEMFFDDAKIISHELNLTLTGRDCGLEERAPMCGIPHHALNQYLPLMVANGHRVAICEQLEDPATAKGIVDRQIVEIVTKGTILNRESLDSTKNNYVACLIYNNNSYAIAISDISTGLFNLYESSSYKDICSFIYKYSPSELITSSELSSDKLLINLSNNIGMIIYNINEDIDYTNANNVVREQFNNCDVIQD